MSKLTYSRDSVERALDIHNRHGLIRSWMRTDPAKPRYRVELYGGVEDLDLRTLREAWIFVVGLATAVHSPHSQIGGRS